MWLPVPFFCDNIFCAPLINVSFFVLQDRDVPAQHDPFALLDESESHLASV